MKISSSLPSPASVVKAQVKAEGNQSGRQVNGQNKPVNTNTQPDKTNRPERIEKTEVAAKTAKIVKPAISVGPGVSLNAAKPATAVSISKEAKQMFSGAGADR